jgi:hypothetical protein
LTDKAKTAAAATAAAILASAGVPAAAAPVFRDATAAAGIDFLQANGATGTKQCQEQMGSGACLFDHDGDGRLDVYLITSVGGSRLYRNLGGLRFADVTARSGLGDLGYGMGATAADYDNDGDQDVFLTTHGPDRLYVNRGDGTFREMSAQAGVADPRFGTSAAFLDYDRDGRLDLYVANYAEVADPDTNVCHANDGTLRLYCPPRRYPPETHLLYRNRGDGTFENVSDRSGVTRVRGRGLGVVGTDFDRDGWIDIYVANDLCANLLFRNRGDGTFEEMGLLTGVSHSESGVELSGMGVAAGDYDNDGWIDLFVTNFVDETNSLYHNEGLGYFLDVSAPSGLGAPSLPYVGWGTKLFDFDLDGWKDVFVANGHTESDAEKSDPTTTWKQRAMLFRNRGDGTFADVTAETAPGMLVPRAGRGAAFGDLDDDGDVDIVVVNQNDRAVLWENTGTPTRHWIGFHTKGTRSNRDGVGARVEIWDKGRLAGAEEVQAGGSYLSRNDPRVHFGLAGRAAVDSVVVQWPSGLHESRPAPAVDRYHLLVEGGTAP